MTTPYDRGWGNPYDKNFTKDLVTVKFGPWPKSKVNKGKGTAHPEITLTIHKLIEPILRFALNEVITTTSYRFDAGAKDDWGWNRRPKRGYETKWKLTKNFKFLSLHSWGIAVDLNALKNPMSGKLITDMPQEVIDIFLKWGFDWGGYYNTRKDPMHFEYTGSKQALIAKLEQLKKFFGG